MYTFEVNKKLLTKWKYCVFVFSITSTVCDIDEDDLWTFCAAFIDYYKIHVKDPLCDFDDDCDIDEGDLWTFCDAFIEY